MGGGGGGGVDRPSNIYFRGATPPPKRSSMLRMGARARLAALEFYIARMYITVKCSYVYSDYCAVHARDS